MSIAVVITIANGQDCPKEQSLSSPRAFPQNLACHPSQVETKKSAPPDTDSFLLLRLFGHPAKPKDQTKTTAKKPKGATQLYFGKLRDDKKAKRCHPAIFRKGCEMMKDGSPQTLQLLRPLASFRVVENDDRSTRDIRANLRVCPR